MHSNKSSPPAPRAALEPQRSHGRLRVAALLEAGSAVIAEKGFEAATMAEIAARAEAPIGSLYRFFPNKEILADALIQRFAGRIDQFFDEIQSRIGTLSIEALTEALFSLTISFRGERLAMKALLEAHSDWSAKRVQFRNTMLQHISTTLALRSPRLKPGMADNMAVVILHNMKTAGELAGRLSGRARSGALSEMHAMTEIYLHERLGEKRP